MVGNIGLSSYVLTPNGSDGVDDSTAVNKKKNNVEIIINFFKAFFMVNISFVNCYKYNLIYILKKYMSEYAK